MSFHLLSLVVGWTAVVLGVVGVAAQFQRVSVRGVEGVSLATWVIFTYMGVYWITYGVIVHSWEIVVGSLVILPVQLAIVFRLSPWRHPRLLLIAFGFFALFTIVPTYLGGWADGIYGIGVAMSLTRVPQLVELIRAEKAFGVSVSSWLINAVGASLWMTYYVGAHLWAPFVATGLAGAVSLAIASLAAWRHVEARRRLDLVAALSD